MNSLWNKYPYTDFHEMNLDWILSRIREMESSISNFINLNTIKYSDPIAWDITSQYESNTVVIDNQTGNAYISTKAVPYGVHISNTNYWTQIYNYANEMNTLREQIAAANEGQSTTASEPRNIDDLVWVKGRLLKIIAPMIAGDSYVIGSNCVYTTIEELLLDNKALDEEIQARIEGDNLLQNNIDTAFTALNDALASEVIARTSEDVALSDRIDILEKKGIFYNVLDFGAIGDGITDDTEAINDTLTAAKDAGGGVVYMPATGHPYLISNPLNIHNGVTLLGVLSTNFEGMNKQVDDWSHFGTWVHPVDNGCVNLSGHGSTLYGINFVYDQPVPTDTFTPLQYPYAINVTSTLFSIYNTVIVGASHGIHVHYPEANGGGTYSSIVNAYISSFDVGLKFENVNDIIYMANIQIRGLYYQTVPSVVSYLESHLVGIDSYYFDNAMINGLQIFNAKIGIKCSDQTCLGNTHSLYNAQFVNTQFNLVNIAIDIPSGVHVQALFDNTLMQSDTETGTTGILYNDNSSFTDITFTNIRVNACRQFAIVTGKLKCLGGYIHYGYGNSICFNIIGNLNFKDIKVSPSETAGRLFAGTNSESGIISQENILFMPLISNEAFEDLSGWNRLTDYCAFRPKHLGCNEIRLLVNGTVNDITSGSVLRYLVDGFREINDSISISSTGDFAIDTSWVPITTVNDVPIGGVFFETDITSFTLTGVTVIFR